MEFAGDDTLQERYSERANAAYGIAVPLFRAWIHERA
jgi:hypothetical protein